jgi:hypothetical protein
VNTTLIFAELLIIGLEVGIWLSFLLLSFLGVNNFDEFLNTITNLEVLVLTITIPVLYVLGIIFDRIVDRLFRSTERRIEAEILKDYPVSVLAMRFSFGNANDSLNQQLDYARTRMRIVRASSINFVLIAVSISTFLLTRIVNVQWQTIVLVLVTGLLLAYVAFVAWQFLVRGHLELAKAMYEYLNPSNKKTFKKS